MEILVRSREVKAGKNNRFQTDWTYAETPQTSYMSEIRILNSFKYALRGLYRVVLTGFTFRVQLLAGVVVIVFMIAYPLVLWERIILILLIGAVLTLEVINSIFERIVDTFKPRIHPVVGEIKDMMAAAVLLTSIVSAIVGLLIFWPHIVG